MSEIKEDGAEIFHYDDLDFPVFVRHNFIPAGFNLHPYTPLHFHDEVEMIYIVDGLIHHQINDKFITIHKGEGLFINSRHFHELITDDVSDCTLYCLIFDPAMLINCVRTEDMVNVISLNENIEYIHLLPSVAFHAGILEIIKRLCDKNSNCSELKAVASLYELWELLFDNLSHEKDDKNRINEDQRTVKKMINYIQHFYQSDIRLENICDVGNVGKTKCTELFSKYSHLTPMDYVRNLRLEKSALLLRETQMSVAQIAYEVGFSSASYYGELFKEKLGMTPLSYRKLLLLERENQ